MQIWFLLFMIACWVSATYFFYNLIYQKIKLHNVRLKMQEQGEISKEDNITSLAFWNSILWLSPVRKYKKIANEEHRKKIRQVNRSLLGLILSIAIYFIVSSFRYNLF